MLNTKKRESCRDVEQHPRVIEARRAITRLKAELDIAQKDQSSSTSGHKPGPNLREWLVARFSATLLARVTGAPPPAPTKIDADITSGEKLKAIRDAIAERENALNRLKIELAPEVYLAWAADDRQSRTELAKAILAAKEAHVADQQLADRMLLAGAYTHLHLRPWLNTSACGAMPRALATMDAKTFRGCNANLLRG